MVSVTSVTGGSVGCWLVAAGVGGCGACVREPEQWGLQRHLKPQQSSSCSRHWESYCMRTWGTGWPQLCPPTCAWVGERYHNAWRFQVLVWLNGWTMCRVHQRTSSSLGCDASMPHHNACACRLWVDITFNAGCKIALRRVCLLFACGPCTLTNHLLPLPPMLPAAFLPRLLPQQHLHLPVWRCPPAWQGPVH